LYPQRGEAIPKKIMMNMIARKEKVTRVFVIILQDWIYYFRISG
jgi:hypothetical protein